MQNARTVPQGTTAYPRVWSSLLDDAQEGITVHWVQRDPTRTLVLKASTGMERRRSPSRTAQSVSVARTVLRKGWQTRLNVPLAISVSLDRSGMSLAPWERTATRLDCAGLPTACLARAGRFCFVSTHRPERALSTWFHFTYLVLPVRKLSTVAFRWVDCHKTLIFLQPQPFFAFVAGDTVMVLA